ncbi:TetR/AcrR family transcriptional regulator [Nocardia vulneris]|uniref:TetR family transcriptional regulator n=1 Tax=Nocardia vulneris TaxID=1141657 RepID=A0ABR4Z495_9NOCA|nr:TetR/AcrR family transcriptional regulator [Nocardia vulneris]KIA60138.1 TetR family transcriptional regulator [Nocardia vulneris]
MPLGPTAKGAATRQRIIAGAAEVILHRGVMNTTLDDIRDHTGTSKSQLFHYFPDGKEQLLTAVAGYEAARVLNAVQERVDPLITWQAWSAWRDQLIGEYDRHGADCSLGVLMNQLAPASPAARAVVAELTTKWHAFVRAGIAEMRRRGDIRPEVDPDRSASAVLAGIHGGVVLLLSTGTVDHLAAALDTAIDYLKG